MLERQTGDKPMKKLNVLHFEGSDILIGADELDKDFLADLMFCGSSGDQSANVQYVMENYDITGDVETCKDALRPYGAWEDDELEDHETNLQRLVWLAGCDLCEQGEIYFSCY